MQSLPFGKIPHYLTQQREYAKQKKRNSFQMPSRDKLPPTSRRRHRKLRNSTTSSALVVSGCTREHTHARDSQLCTPTREES